MLFKLNCLLCCLIISIASYATVVVAQEDPSDPGVIPPAYGPIETENEGPWLDRHHEAFKTTLARSYDMDNEEVAPGIVARYGTRKFRVSQGAVSVAVSRDGKWIAACGQRGTIWLYPSDTGRVKRVFDISPRAHVMGLSHDARYLVYLSNRKDNGEAALVVYDIQQNEQLFYEWMKTSSFSRIRWSPDGETVVITLHEKMVIMKKGDWENKQLIDQIDWTDIRFGEASSKVYGLNAATGKVELFDLEKKEKSIYSDLDRKALGAENEEDTIGLISSLAINEKTGKMLIGGAFYLSLWDAKTGTQEKEFTWKEKPDRTKRPAIVVSVDWMDDKSIVARSLNQLRVYDLTNAEKPKRTVHTGYFVFHLRYYSSIYAKADNDEVTVSQSGRNSFVQVLKGNNLKGMIGKYDPQNSIGDFQVFPGGAEVWLMDSNRFMRFHRFTGKGRGMQYVHHIMTYNSGSVSPDGKTLLTVASGDTINFWNLEGKVKRIHRYKAKTGRTWRSAYSPDGRVILIHGERGISFYDWQEKKFLKVIPRAEHFGQRRPMFSHDGKYAVVSSYDGVEVFDTGSYEVVWKLPQEGRKNRTAGWLLNGRALVVVSNLAFSIYEMPSGKLVMNQPVTYAKYRNRRVSIHPSERWIMLNTAFGFEIIEAATGKRAFIYDIGHNSGINAIKTTADGDYVVTVSDDTTGLMFSLNPMDYMRNSKHLWPAIPREKWWASIGTEADPREAYLAIWSMVMSPADAMAMVKEKLKVSQTEAVDIAKWIQQLNADDFDEREAAVTQLLKIGKPAEASLREVMENTDSLEQRELAREVLAQMGTGQITSEDDLRIIRLMAMMEWLRNDEAKEVLTQLSKGSPSLQTEQAKATLKRIAQYEALQAASQSKAAKMDQPKKKKKKK